jgi:hypothetical protein
VRVNLLAGTAELHVHNFALGDYFTKANALGANWQTNFVPATVSFDVTWGPPVTRALLFQDKTNLDHFGGAFFENRATVSWSGTNASGFSFTANPGDFSTSFDPCAQLGLEANGSFLGDGGWKAGDRANAHAHQGRERLFAAAREGAGGPLFLRQLARAEEPLNTGPSWQEVEAV